MQVLKFGGTSVGSAENMRKVASIISDVNGIKIVVLSAMSGTTNSLVKISDFIKNDKRDRAFHEIDFLKLKYQAEVEELFYTEESLEKVNILLNYYFNSLVSKVQESYSSDLEKEVLAVGELLSTNIFQLFLEQEGFSSKLISALSFMKIDNQGKPDMEYISKSLTKILKKNQEEIIVTQGFICVNEAGKIDNLQRGGSDYTASLIGAAIQADQIQIFTDIDGMHNNDPRYVEDTFSVEEISFEEAAELAYFGAKILHPQSILPAKEYNIPVLVKNTFDPSSKGTLIHNSKTPDNKIRAIAAKDGITAIKIKSYRMLMAYGFLKKVFEVFEQHQTSIDMITTSEVAVSLTIDDDSRLNKIVQDLEGICNIEVENELSIICVAGDLSQNKSGITAEIFNCLKDIPIRMISYGGSNYNLSFLVKSKHKKNALNLLNHGLFNVNKKREIQVKAI
ncbi:MAG: aspartate kinase [Flavobacteriia bacterium]|nr:MAG: aspartate kinase [Flavobacteriia bacterium]